MSQRNAVILVDHRTRDLLCAALIAHHLETRGVQCHLEPLESYHSCLAAYSPDVILFNHLNSSPLVRYSRRLKDLNVLTAVLPNEGILYDEDTLKYNSGRHHKGSNINFFFCWNEVHRQALKEVGPGGPDTRIEVCGVPRFDFYFEPWSRAFRPATPPPKPRPHLLLCTNFGFARYDGLSEADAQRFAAPFQCIPLYKNYRANIQTQVRSREGMLKFLAALAESGEFDITLRPHPREVPEYYRDRMKAWSAAARERVKIDSTTAIHELIPACDLELSCETCTTAMETWIARKPTIELVFERNPLFFHENQARLNVLAEDPAKIVQQVKHELAHPDQAAYWQGRAEHLAKWCHSPDGKSSERVAEVLAQAIHAKPPVKSDFTLVERRKAAKLKLLRSMNLPYNFAPMLKLKEKIAAKSYATKGVVARKTIRPSDVVEARAKLAAAMAGK